MVKIHKLHAFYKQHFYKQHQAEISKNSVKTEKTKQHPQVELSLFENYSLSSSMLWSKNKRAYYKIFAN